MKAVQLIAGALLLALASLGSLGVILSVEKRQADPKTRTSENTAAAEKFGAACCTFVAGIPAVWLLYRGLARSTARGGTKKTPPKGPTFRWPNDES
jgi:hypothetical protein